MSFRLQTVLLTAALLSTACASGGGPEAPELDLDQLDGGVAAFVVVGDGGRDQEHHRDQGQE